MPAYHTFGPVAARNGPEIAEIIGKGNLPALGWQNAGDANVVGINGIPA